MSGTAALAGRHVDVNDVSLYVEEHGTGEPLVFVNPGFCSSLAYEPVVPLLAAHFHVITFDSRGHGRSTNPSGQMTYEMLADDAAALIEQLGLDRPFVGGWSDGGEVALQVGLRHPGRARALIVGGTSLELGSEKTKAQMRDAFCVDANGVVDYAGFKDRFGESLLPLMRKWHPKDEQQMHQFVQQSLTMWLTYGERTREQIARVEAPALVIVGDRDEHVPVEEAVRLCRWLPNAELAILPGTSHMRPLFDPETFSRCIADFMQRH